MKRQVYSCHSELAHVLRENDELDEPLGIYRDLLPRWKDLGHRAAVAHELECIGFLLMKKDQTYRAAIILGAADSLRGLTESTTTPVELVEYERELLALRGKMDASEYETAWKKGQTFTMDQAISLAVQAD